MNTALTNGPSSRLARVFPFGVDLHSMEVETVVVDQIQPFLPGTIKFMGIWWRARCHQTLVLLPGTRVRVVDRENLTLIVEPIVPI